MCFFYLPDQTNSPIEASKCENSSSDFITFSVNSDWYWIVYFCYQGRAVEAHAACLFVRDVYTNEQQT